MNIDQNGEKTMMNDPKSQMEQDIDRWSQQRLNLWYRDTVDRSLTADIKSEVILSSMMLTLIHALAQMTIIGKIPTGVVHQIFVESVKKARQKGVS